MRSFARTVAAQILWFNIIVACLLANTHEGPALSHVGVAVISGTVLAEESDGLQRAVEGAVVSLRSSPPREVMSQVTDTQGRFRFAEVPAGRYRVEAEKPAYVRTEHGAFRHGEMGTPIAIGQDEVIQDLVIVLRRRSSVSGLVRGADGIPIRDMAVVARHSSGTRHSVKSDGTGLYRVYGLAPGTYSMSVEPTTTAKPEPGPMAPVEVKLGAGEERHGVDILLAPAGSGQIRARVVAHDGQAPQSASVSLIGEHETIRRGLVRGAEGFLASGLSPGRYTVTAATYAPPRARGLPSLETLTDRRPTQWAEEIAVVTNGNLSEVVLHLRPTLLFSGQVIIDEPPSTPRSNHPAITLTRIRNPMPPLSAQVASGKFALANVTPGLYRVGVDRSDVWYVSALRTSTVASSPIVEVTRARGDLEDVSVTVSRRWSTLSGSLLGTEQSPAIDYWVVAFPVTENFRYPDSPFVQRTRPDTRGIFVFEQLPIGDFHVAVLRDGDADWTHSDFLKRLASSAVRVTLTDRAPTAINLRISR